MQEWMRPGPVTRCQVMLDPRVGGTFRILMDAHGAQIVNTGEFLLLQRPAKLQFTWVSSRWEYQETLITVELYPHGVDCELVLTYERFPADHSAVQLMTGWTQMLEKALGASFHLVLTGDKFCFLFSNEYQFAVAVGSEL